MKKIKAHGEKRENKPEKRLENMHAMC